MEITDQIQAGLSDDEILRAVQDEISAIDTDDGDDAEALDYFHARRPAVTKAESDAGMCDFVSTDVRDGVHATLAEIMPAFQGNSPVEFPPRGNADEDQAALESEIVNHAIMGMARGYMKVQQAIKDILLLRRGHVKVWVDERVKVEYETIEGIPEPALPMALQPKRPDESVEILGQEMVQEAQIEAMEIPVTDQFGNVAAINTVEREVSPAIYSLSLKRKWICKKFCVESTPKDEVLVNRDHNSWDLDEARFVAHQRVCSKSDLISLGVDPEELEDVQRYTYSQKNEENARNRKGYSKEHESGHESTDPYLLTECWYHIDADGDGIAERRHLWIVGDESGNGKLVLNEPINRQPFASGNAYLGFYEVDGISLFDTLKIVQDVKTKLIRQIINLGNRLLKGRFEVVDNGDVNIDDLEDSIDGGYVRVNKPGLINPIPEPRADQSIYQLLELMDQKRRESGGSAVDSATQAMQASADTWRGLERVMGVIEQVNAMLARTISETLVKSLYLKAHEALRENWQGEIAMRIGGGWVQQDPSQWQPREDVSARIGLSGSERAQMQQVMSGIVQNLTALAEKGSVIANEAKLHEALVDQVRYAGISDPSQYYVDPQSPEGQQAAQQKQQAAQQQAAAQEQATREQLMVPLQMEEIRAQGRLQQQAMQNQQKVIEQQAQLVAEMKQHTDKLALDYDKLAAELAKYNAEYDAQPVPDSIGEL